MELVDLKHLRDRRQRSRYASAAKSFGEPLLDGAVGDSDPHTLLPSDVPDRSYRPSRISAAAVNFGWFGNGQTVVPPTGIPTYVPPRPVNDGRGTRGGAAPLMALDNSMVRGEDATAAYARAPELYFDGPQPPSIMRAVRRQTPERTVSMSFRSSPVPLSAAHAQDDSYLERKNPIQDIGGLFSYGFFCVQCVRTQEVGIIEDMGRFTQLLEPGMYIMCWPFSDISGRLSLRIQQLDVVCETKTKDDVFVHLAVSVLFKVIAEKSYDAFYRLTDPRMQIRSYVYDVVRSTVPRLSLDEVFASKSAIAKDVLESLHHTMHEYGYEIKETLVVDISPDPLVRSSMNEMQASKRLKEAMAHTAESKKVQTIKAAGAAAEASYLSGVGVARQRKAIAESMKESVAYFSSRDRICADDAMTVLLLSQYLETLNTLGADDIIIRPNPDEASRVRRQLEAELPCTSMKINLIPDLLS